jgi:hypothetical protein
MVQMTEGSDPRTSRPIDPDYANWTTHPEQSDVQAGRRIAPAIPVAHVQQTGREQRPVFF